MSPRLRIAAFLLDYLLILGYLTLLAGVGLFATFGPFGDAWSGLLSSPRRLDLLAFLTTVLPVGAYFAWSEGWLRGPPGGSGASV